MANTLESLLRYFDSLTGLDRLSIPYWLAIVMVSFLFSTVFSELFEKQNAKKTSKTRRSFHIGTLLLIGFSALLTLSAWSISYYTGYYYNFHVVLGLIAQMISALVLSLTWSGVVKSQKIAFAEKILLHLNAIVIIFVVSGRWLIRGVDAEETSADTLNIYYNGGFRRSMHAGWYDLAPVDSILKVIMLWVNGNRYPYSPFESFLISFTSSLTLYFLVYIVIKNLFFLENMLPLIPALLAIHPYAFLSGAPITPTNIATALALSSLLVFLIIQQNLSRSYLVVSTTLFIASSLAHPFSLSVLIFTATCLLAKYFNKSLRSLDILFLITTSIPWLAKTTYTATVYGIASIWNSVINGIFQAWERESIIAFRNVGYSGLPKLALSSFSASIGIIGGLALITLTYLVPWRRVKNSGWIDHLILFFAGLTGLMGLFATIGGQSRYIFLPFASLFFVPILFYVKTKGISSLLKVLITSAAILTVLTPNFIPDQYSIPMSAKISDVMMFTITETLFEKLDPTFVIERFQGVSGSKLCIVQKGDFIRNKGESGLITDKLILRGLVKAGSYWDFLGRGPFDAYDEDENRVYSVVIDCELLRVLLS